MITNNQARQSLRYAVMAAAMFLIPAPTALANPQADRSLEQRSCAVAMNLNPATADYDVCVRSLDRALSDAGSGHYVAVPNERRACADIGINPRSPAFDRCADDLRNSLWNDDDLGAR